MAQDTDQKERRATRRGRAEQASRKHRTLAQKAEEGIHDFRVSLEARIAALPQKERRAAEYELQKAIRGKRGASLKEILLATEASLRERHPGIFGPSEEERGRMIESARRLEQAKIEAEAAKQEARARAAGADAKHMELLRAARRALEEGEEEAAREAFPPPPRGASERELAETGERLAARLTHAERRATQERGDEKSREKRRGDIMRKVIAALAEERGVALPLAVEDIRISYVVPQGAARKPLMFSNSRDLFEYLRAHPEFRTKEISSKKKIEVKMDRLATQLFEEGQPLAEVRREFDDALLELEVRPYEAIAEELAEEASRVPGTPAGDVAAAERRAATGATGEAAPAGTPVERIMRMVPPPLQETALALYRRQMEEAAHGRRLAGSAFDVLPETYRAPVKAFTEEAAAAIETGPAATERDRALAPTGTAAQEPAAPSAPDRAAPEQAADDRRRERLLRQVRLQERQIELARRREAVQDRIITLSSQLLRPSPDSDALEKEKSEAEGERNRIVGEQNSVQKELEAVNAELGIQPVPVWMQRAGGEAELIQEEAPEALGLEPAEELTREQIETEVRERIQTLDPRRRAITSEAARLTGAARASETVGTNEALAAAMGEIEAFFNAIVPFFAEANAILKRAESFKQANPEFFSAAKKKLEDMMTEVRDAGLSIADVKERVSRAIEALGKPAVVEPEPVAEEAALAPAAPQEPEPELPVQEELVATPAAEQQPEAAEPAKEPEAALATGTEGEEKPSWFNRMRGSVLRLVPKRKRPAEATQEPMAAATETPLETKPTMAEVPVTPEPAATMPEPAHEAAPAAEQQPEAARAVLEEEQTPESRLASARQEYVKADAAFRESRARYGFGIGSSARFESVVAAAKKSWAALKKRPGGELDITPDTLEANMREDLGSGAIQELDRIRADYDMDAYREFLASLITLSEKKADYDRARVEAAEEEYKKKAEGGAPAPEADAERRADIFTKFVLRERELLLASQAEAMPKKKRSAATKLLRRLAGKWVSLPGWQRRALSSAFLVTLGAATGYIPGIPEALYAFGARLGLGAAAGSVAQGVGLVTEAAFALLKQKERSPEDLKGALKKLAEEIEKSGVLPEEELAALEERAATLYKEQSRRRTVRLATKAGLMIGTTMAAGRVGGELLSSWLGISPTTGAAHRLDRVTVPPPSPTPTPEISSAPAIPRAEAYDPFAKIPGEPDRVPLGPAPHEVVPPTIGAPTAESAAALAEKLEQASVVGKGQGIWHAVRSQLSLQAHADPEKFATVHGAAVDDLEHPLKFKRLLEKLTGDILKREGFVKPDGEVWIAKPGTHVTLGEGDAVTIEGGEGATMWHPRAAAEEFPPIDVAPEPHEAFPTIDIRPGATHVAPQTTFEPAAEPHFEPVPVPPPPEIHHATHLTGDGFETVTHLGVPREAAHDWALSTTVFDLLHHRAEGLKLKEVFKLDAAIERLHLRESDMRAMTMADLFEHHGKALTSALKAVEHQIVGPFAFKDAVSFVRRLGFKSLEGQDHLSHVSVKSFVSRVPADERLWPELLKRGGSLFTSEEFPHPPKVTVAQLRLGRALQVLRIGTDPEARDTTFSALFGSMRRLSRIKEVYDRIT